MCIYCMKKFSFLDFDIYGFHFVPVFYLLPPPHPPPIIPANCFYTQGKTELFVNA